MSKVLPIALGVGAGILLLSATAGAMPTGTFTPKYDKRTDEQQRIWALARQAEAAGAPAGLAPFLIPVAFIESRFNPNAKVGSGPNDARGWFQLRPESAFNWRNKLTHLQDRPDLLFDRKWAVATAADYAYRLARFNSAPGQRVDWAAIRRGWKYPSFVKKTSGDDVRRNRNQYIEAAQITGIPTSILNKRVEIGDYPGIEAILNALGAKSA